MNIDNKASSWKFWTQRRHIFTIMAFFGFFNIYSLRANMSIAIVAMTSARSSINENGTTIYLDPEFSWDNKIQGYLLGSFFYGYITSQLLGGFLSKKFGGKWIFGGGIASTGFLTLISPWLAEWSVYALLVCRILMGVFEGLTYSSIYSLFTKWIPTQERCRVSSQAVSGCYIGAVFALMFLAYLAKVAGWRSIFWVSGSISLIWFIFWSYFISESPETDPRISDSELRYIHEQSFTVSRSPEITPIKWKNIVCSKAAWALNVAVFCESWGFYTLLTLLPKYFKDIYGFDISESGIVSALPYLALSIMIHVSGQISDRLSMRGWLSVTKLRKIFMGIGFLAQVSFMLGATFWGDVSGTVFCLTMAIGLGSMAITVTCVNPLDIAPLNSAIIIGSSNTCGTISGIISPIIAGYLISTTNPTVLQWRIVFYIAAGLYFFGAIFFTLFGSGTRQYWDFPESEKAVISTKIMQNSECITYTK